MLYRKIIDKYIKDEKPTQTLINFNRRQRASSTAHNRKTRRKFINNKTLLLKKKATKPNYNILISKYFCRLDCGIIVCYIMRQYVSKNNIMPTFSKEECNQLRANMLTIFLTDQQVAQRQIPDEIIDDLPLL